MDDYKPLTPEQITAAAKGADCTLLLKDYSFSMPAFARAVETAVIENYLAQREPADAWLLTLRSLLNDLIIHAQANGLEIARAGDVLESTAQVGFRLAGILEHAKRFVSTSPAPQDAQAEKDAERYRQARTMPLVIDNSRIAPHRPDKFDAMIDAAIAAAKGKE